MATLVVTGISRGIGRHVTAQLLSAGHRVLGIARDVERGRAAHPGAVGLEVFACDLSRLAAVRALAGQLENEPIDGIVHVAGAVFDGYGETEDGFERTLGINHLAPYLLTRLLLPQLLDRPRARIVDRRLSGPSLHRAAP